ncbi:MAG TPA: class I SAM-dependent methyltransferase [Herpetosiphonaceae bacterium]
MTTAAEHSKQPTFADYDDAYFATLYGDIPRQTAIDVARDRLIRRLVMRHSAGGSLLEVGCGFGYLLAGFDRRWRLYGTDISAHAAAVAQRRLAHAHVLAADLQQGIPFRLRFDVLIAVNVMEHLSDPRAAAEGIAKAVRPGGIFVAHLPTINNALNRWIYARTYERDPTHVYRPSGVEFNRLLEDAGFRTLHALYCPFWPARLWQRLKPHPAYLAVFERR